MLFPLYAVIIASFENNSQLLGTHYNFLPPTPSFANYSAVISTQGGHIVSTLLIGVGTALLTLAISLPAAHALARYRFRVTALLIGGLLVAQVLPSIVIANSLFLLYHKLHLLNSYPGLILADASYAVPVQHPGAPRVHARSAGGRPAGRDGWTAHPNGKHSSGSSCR